MAPLGPRELGAAGLASVRGGLRALSDFNPREWRILAPLMFVGFFEVYDLTVLTIGAPQIADGLGVSIGLFGVGVAVIRLAALGSVPILRAADRIGRRTMLLISIAAFTAATGLTALAWGLAAFVAIQTVARAFLATESSLGGVVIAEEVRRERRGAALSLVGVISFLGPGLTALAILAVPLTPLDWRIFYVIALPPLFVIAYLRRNLGETTAFSVARTEERLQPALIPRVPPPYGSRLRRIATVFGVAGAIQTAAFFYSSALAQDGYGWDALYTVTILSAGPFALAGFLLGGPGSDRIGRRPVLAAALVMGVVANVMIFSEVRLMFAPGFWVAAGSNAAVLAVGYAYLSELFPTELRATLTSIVIAAQIAGGSLALLLIGALAGAIDTSLQLVLGGLAATPVILLLRDLPETRGSDVIQPGTSPG
ncbi:MAG TPA: MFS transporter [Solirubrobacterales bacterium]|nr:MFS transporter [Solirubrobacterales bacterium]